MVRGRPEKLTNELKRQIAAIKKNNSKKWTLEMIQAELKQTLWGIVKKEHQNWDKKLIGFEVDERLPGISSIQKYIKTTLQPQLDSPSELEDLWHIGLMRESFNKVSVEAVSHILKVQKWVAKEGGIRQVTVRQAIWISRLYTTAYDAKELWKVSYAYSIYELMCDLSNTPFDTTLLDEGLRNIGKMKGDSKFIDALEKLTQNSDFYLKAYLQIEDL